MQNPENDSRQEQINPDQEAIALVRETREELAEYRKTFEKQWREEEDAYYGKQHKTGDDVKTVKNHIFKIIEGEIPVLTDSMPGTQLTASKSEKQAAALMLEKGIQWTYHDQSLQLLLPSLMRSALMAAPGWLHAQYNTEADGGDGKIEYRQLPWKSVFIDGNAQTIEQAEKAHIEIPMRRGALARMWPEKKSAILKLQGKTTKNEGADDNFETRDVSGPNSNPGKPKQHQAKDIVLYKETWIKSYDLIDIDPEETNEQLAEEGKLLQNAEAPSTTKWMNHDAHIESHRSIRAELLSVVGLPPEASFEEAQSAVEQLLQQSPQAAEQFKKGLLALKVIDNHIEEHEEFKKLNPSGQEPKYKDGWRVIKSVESTVLYDGENPERNGHIPLVPFYCYKDDSIYGFSETRNILNPQRSFNDMDWREQESLRVNSNSGWIGDKETEVDPDTLTNRPGIVVLKKRGTELRRLEPGQTSPQLERRKEGDAQAMDSIAGNNEASMNGGVKGQLAEGTLKRIQTQATGRIRLKDRNLNYYSMKRLALITGSLIINHWTEEKLLRFRSDGTNIEEVIYNPLEVDNLEYIVEMSPGSMAGIDKDSLNAFYYGLLQIQQITIEEFLQVAQLPQKDVLLKMVQERNQNQQAQQMQQMQQEAQAQIQQVTAQAQDIQAQAQKLKGENDALKGVLTPSEKRLHAEMLRQAAIASIQEQDRAEEEMKMENNGANDGQPENQG